MPHNKTSKCSGVVPNSVAPDSKGIVLYSSGNLYHYFDGNKGQSWPTHDPCGKTQSNQLKSVANPHGNIFIR